MGGRHADGCARRCRKCNRRKRTDAVSHEAADARVDAGAELWLCRAQSWPSGRLAGALQRQAATLDDTVAALSHVHQSGEIDELHWWSSALLLQAGNWLRDFRLLVSESVTAPATQPTLASSSDQATEAAKDISSRLAKIAGVCQRLFDEMDFKFLLEQERKVFTVGFNVSEGRRDNSFYDLLASEARLASFIAIAKGDVPQEHWFRMAATYVVDGGRALISWTAHV